jgi:hypothetical protein
VASCGRFNHHKKGDTPVGTIHSIQGERQDAIRETFVMDMADVETYVETASDEVLLCREDRHTFASIRQGVHFEKQNSDGDWVRELPCTQCGGLAVRVEVWESIGSGDKRRFRRLSRTLRYPKRADGTSYLADSGRGRPTKKQIGDVLMTMALRGYTITDIRKNNLTQPPKRSLTPMLKAAGDA